MPYRSHWRTATLSSIRTRRVDRKVRIPGHVNKDSGDVNNGFRGYVNNHSGLKGMNFSARPGMVIHIPGMNF